MATPTAGWPAIVAATTTPGAERADPMSPVAAVRITAGLTVHFAADCRVPDAGRRVLACHATILAPQQATT